MPFPSKPILLLIATCLVTCTREDGLERPSNENNDVRAAAEPPMPGPRRGRLLQAVRDNDECVVCHDEQAREWRGSMHQRADVDAAYRHAFAIEPTAFCRGCHAPEGDPERDAPAPVSEIGVACVTCHVTEEGAILAAPATNLDPAPHPLRRSAAFAASGGCVNCHEFPFPGPRLIGDDADGSFMQTTIREHARSGASDTSCAACHMPVVAGHRSHSFAQVRDPEWLRKNLVVEAKQSAFGGAEITLRQVKPGHGFPTGDLFRRLEVGAELRDTDGRVVRRDVRYLARQFVERPHRGGRELSEDDRVFDEPVVIDLDIAPSSKFARKLEVVSWVKLQRVATVGTGFNSHEAEVESEVELHRGVFAWQP